jgi:CspA family cold shock protein
MDALSRRYRGIVREFDKSRGCGTIDVETGECVFVRYSAIVGQGLRMLRSGDHVSFDVEQSRRGPTAVRVTVTRD